MKKSFFIKVVTLSILISPLGVVSNESTITNLFYHSYVLLCDGAALAHLGYPDMRVPIAYALHHPDRADLPVKPLDLATVGALTFEPVDNETFPCLELARSAGKAGGTAPCILNAANEVAVHAFLNGRLSFLGIARVIEETLTQLDSGLYNKRE